MTPRSRLAVALAAALLAAMTVCAEPAPAQPAAVQPDARSDWNFPSVPLGAFMKAVSEKGNLKLVCDVKLAKTPISVYLPSATAQQALDAVCDANGLYYESQPDSGVMVIREQESAFFKLQHADTKSLKDALTTMAGDKGKVSFDDKNNVVAVKGRPQDIKHIREMIANVDREPRQVLIEATFAELTDKALRDLGVKWKVNASLTGASRETAFPIGYFKDDVDKAREWGMGRLSFADASVQLEAMESEGKATVLAKPRIMALDGREAQIKITTNTVIATKLTRQSTGQELVTEEPVYAEVGITLKTTPRIHPTDKITLMVEPSVSTASQSPFFKSAVDTFSRSAVTTLVVEHGQTVVIGGLLRREENEITQKVPVLGNLPLVGNAFTHRHKDHEKRDLVVFLTPRILDKQASELEAAKAKARVVKEFGREEGRAIMVRGR
jgi:type II secretory pathway component GspD/PulD (secretin)